VIRSRAEGAACVEGRGRRTVGFFRAGPAAEGRWRSRSPLASYGTLMGIEAPDIFGLGVEEVARLTAEGAGR
jgi:hypothetical protein